MSLTWPGVMLSRNPRPSGRGGSQKIIRAETLLEKGQGCHRAQDSCDPAMHLDRRHRVLVDEGRRPQWPDPPFTYPAPHLRRRCPGWDGGSKSTASRLLPAFPIRKPWRFTRCSVSSLTPMMGRPNAAPEENRDAGQDFRLPCALDINMPIRERSARTLHQRFLSENMHHGSEVDATRSCALPRPSGRGCGRSRRCRKRRNRATGSDQIGAKVPLINN